MQEFVALMHKKIADDEHNDDIEEAFKVFDTKNDGYLHSLFIFNEYNINISFKGLFAQRS